jgi:1,4-alpha-glucan branching enzyme
MGYMMMHPGKKLMFMGGEFGQWHEWRDYEDLAWGALQHPHHRQLQSWCRALNRLYRDYPELHGSDNSWDGFRWLEADNANESVFAFVRQRLPGEGGTHLLVIFNATPVPRDSYTFGAPVPGRYRKLLDSDDGAFGGSGYSQQTETEAYGEGWRDFPARLTLNVPPLSVTIWASDQSLVTSQ